MRKKALTWTIVILAVALLGFNSVYFKKLDEIKAARTSKQFDAVAYAQHFWTKKLLPNLDKAVNIDTLVRLIDTDTARAFDTYSHALGIGNLRYFLISGSGLVTAIDSDDVYVLTTGGQSVKIATEYIFGNAVRDGSGLIDINDFINTMDFNNVSAEINNIIRKEVLPQFKASVKKGNQVLFTGAIELNRQHVKLESMELIPVKLLAANKISTN